MLLRIRKLLYATKAKHNVTIMAERDFQLTEY